MAFTESADLFDGPKRASEIFLFRARSNELWAVMTAKFFRPQDTGRDAATSVRSFLKRARDRTERSRFIGSLDDNETPGR
jgi:hypothetical protein